LKQKKTGKGTYIWESGSIYVGEWKDDKRHGNGIMISKNGFIYIGEWEQDKPHGFGVEFTQDGKVLKKGKWANGSYVSE
jgi:hypothetical protein